MRRKVLSGDSGEKAVARQPPFPSPSLLFFLDEPTPLWFEGQAERGAWLCSSPYFGLKGNVALTGCLKARFYLQPSAPTPRLFFFFLLPLCPLHFSLTPAMAGMCTQRGQHCDGEWREALYRGEAIVISSIPGMTERYLPDGRVRGLREGAEKGGRREEYRSCCATSPPTTPHTTTGSSSSGGGSTSSLPSSLPAFLTA